MRLRFGGAGAVATAASSMGPLASSAGAALPQRKSTATSAGTRMVSSFFHCRGSAALTLSCSSGMRPSNGGADARGDLLYGEPLLLPAIAVAERDGAVSERIAIDGDAERRADLVLAAVPLPDVPVVVPGDRRMRC